MSQATEIVRQLLGPAPEKRVFHFSGGRTSAYMVLHFYRPGDLVIFCDTGREHEDTYRFVRDFEARTGIPVIRLQGDFRKDVIVRERMIPNRYKRKCTINLKIKKARRYLRSIGWYRYTQFVGFRVDEPVRVKTYFHAWQAVKTVFPLFDAGVDKPAVNAFWAPVPWRLTIPAILGNCDLCFQKGIAAIIAILQKEPWRADPWMEDEENKELNPNGYTYFKGVTIRELRDRALSLKQEYDLENIQAQLSCSCTA